MLKISAIIQEVATKLKIPYQSKHFEETHNNIAKLSEIYLDLKIMIGTLSEIEDNYPDLEIKRFFEKVIEEMEIIDHEIIESAILLSKKKKNV